MEYELNHLQQPVGLSIGGWKAPEIPKPTIMHGRFCRLEPLEWEKHGESLFEANRLDTEGKSWAYMFYGPFETIDAYKNWMTQYRDSKDPQFYAIIDAKKNKAVGVASYLRIDPTNGCIEVGHLLYSPLLTQTPASTEAMYLMMKNVFELGYRRYEWKCNALNTPSRNTAQRLGFSYEGIFRQATIVKGRNRDTAWYAMIDKEWPALKEAFTKWLSLSNFDQNGMQKIKLSFLTKPILVNIG